MKLYKVLGISPIELFTMESQNMALEVIKAGREDIKSAPKLTKERMEKVLNVLEDMVRDFYTELSEKRGPIYEAAWLYIKSAVDPSADWLEPLVKNIETTLKQIPIFNFGTRNDPVLVLRPSHRELVDFALRLGERKSLENLLRENVNSIRDYVEYIIENVAMNSTVIEGNKVVFMNDRVLELPSEDDVARVAYKISHPALVELRKKWYESLTKALYEELGKTGAVYHKTEYSPELIVDLNPRLTREGIPYTGMLKLEVMTAGLYPEKMHIDLRIGSDKNLWTVTLASDVEIPKPANPSPEEYAKIISKELAPAIEKAVDIARTIYKPYHELESTGNAVFVYDIHGDASTWGYVLSVISHSGLWKEETHLRYKKDELQEVTVTLNTNIRSVSSIVDRAEWREKLQSAVAKNLNIEYFDIFADRVFIKATPTPQATRSISELYTELSNAIEESFLKCIKPTTRSKAIIKPPPTTYDDEEDLVTA